MITRVYAVYDNVGLVFTQPMFLTNDDVAMRIMKNCVNSPEHQYHLNPDSYSLYYIGTYDDERAYFDLLSTPKKILDLETIAEVDVDRLGDDELKHLKDQYLEGIENVKQKMKELDELKQSKKYGSGLFNKVFAK